MARLGYTSVSGEYEAPRDFEPVPAGKYPMQVIASEVTQTAKGGEMAKLQWQIIAGPHENRIIFSQHNTLCFDENGNEKAEPRNIGRGELQGFADAMGVSVFDDTEALHNIPVIGHVTIEYGKPKPDGNGKYPNKNIIRRASPMQSAGVATPAKKPVAPAASQRSASPSTTQAHQAARQNAARASGTNGLAGREANPFGD